MEQRQVGTSPLRFSLVGVGAWLMGGQGWGPVDDSDSVAAIHRAIELGVNWVDTAEGYGEDGHSETVVGRALVGRYDRCMVATKLMGDINYEGVRRKCEASLRRLQTEVIHLYQIHWPSSDVPIGETMRALVELQQEGKIVAIGLSNFDAAQIEEAMQYGRIDCLQPPYSLFWRHIEREILPFCIKHGIGVIPYSPLAQGLLTGKFTMENRPGKDEWRANNLLFKPGVYEVALEAVDQLRPFAAKYGITLSQLALRWLIQTPGVTAPIAGARNPSQVEENVGAASTDIEREDMFVISAIGQTVMDALPDDSPNMWR